MSLRGESTICQNNSQNLPFSSLRENPQDFRGNPNPANLPSRHCEKIRRIFVAIQITRICPPVIASPCDSKAKQSKTRESKRFKNQMLQN
ncbi:hypothetical protein ACWIUD_03750 [Helicobacter sp. 23-1044]